MNWRLPMAGLIAAGVAILACSGSTPSFSENVRRMSSDPFWQNQKRDTLVVWRNCVESLGKVSCLSEFMETQGKELSSCLEVFDGGQCELNLREVAADYRWGIPTVDRRLGLPRDQQRVEYYQTCVADVDEFNCLTRLAVDLQHNFAACAELWQGNECGQVIGELLAAANLRQLD